MDGGEGPADKWRSVCVKAEDNLAWHSLGTAHLVPFFLFFPFLFLFESVSHFKNQASLSLWRAEVKCIRHHTWLTLVFETDSLPDLAASPRNLLVSASSVQGLQA